MDLDFILAVSSVFRQIGEKKLTKHNTSKIKLTQYGHKVLAYLV